MSASIMGRLYGGELRREDTVDLPVAIEPVSPIISILTGWYGVVWCGVVVVEGEARLEYVECRGLSCY